MKGDKVMSARDIVKKDPADFTPTLGNYKDLQPFRFWCQKVLPLVYDDSLSYYELLCKVVDYLNKTMEDVNVLEGDVTRLHEAYKKLQGYVNDYFSTLDVQKEINNKLDAMADDGSLSDILKKIVKINQPILVNSKQEMTEHDYLYILATDGFVYYYDGSKFTPSSMQYNVPINAYQSHASNIVVNIDDIKNIGSYSVNTESLTGLVNENLGDYFWSCCCVAPIVRNNNDVLQYLTGIPITQNKDPVFYCRYSYLGVFSNFIKRPTISSNIKDYYTSHKVNNAVNINDIKNAGSYNVNTESLTGLVSETVNEYFWSCYCVTPVILNNNDVLQYLIGIPISRNKEAVFYYRYSYLGTFTSFTKQPTTPSNIKDYYTSHKVSDAVNINDIKNVGSYNVNTESLTGLVSETVDKYFWCCYCITPIIQNNNDVLQFLIGIPISSKYYDPVFYYRYSYLGKFTDFTKTINKKLKKVCFCGDSFTAVTSVKSYVDFLNEFKTCDGTNLGVSGSYPASWLEKHENDITPDYDIYFLAFGLNALNTPNGNYNDSTNDTFSGQMNILIDKIYSVCPNARIIVWCMDGWFLEARSNALKKVSDYKGCEFYSMKADKNIPIRLNGKFEGILENLSDDVVTLKNNALMLSDSHPNEKAQKLLATYLSNII